MPSTPHAQRARAETIGVHALSPKAARGEVTGVYALSPLGERVSVSRRTGEGVGPSQYCATQLESGCDSNLQEV